MKLKNILALIFCLTTIFAISGCNNTTNNEDPPPYIEQPEQKYKLNYTQKTIGIYEYFQLSLLGADGQVEWITSDSSIVTVEDGMIFGVKKGNAVVTATFENDTYSCLVSVGDKSLVPTVKIDLVYDCVHLTVGSEYTLLPYIMYGTETFDDAIFAFETMDASVVEVAQDGKLTAKGVGETTVYVTATWRGVEAVYSGISVIVQ